MRLTAPSLSTAPSPSTDFDEKLGLGLVRYHIRVVIACELGSLVGTELQVSLLAG